MSSVMNPLKAMTAMLRSKTFMPQDNPSKHPLAQLFKQFGYPVILKPLWPQVSSDSWLLATVKIGNTYITYRHPEPELILIIHIQKDGNQSSISSALKSVCRFALYLLHPDSKIQIGIWSLDNMQKNTHYPYQKSFNFFSSIFSDSLYITHMNNYSWLIFHQQDKKNLSSIPFWKKIIDTEMKNRSFSTDL